MKKINNISSISGGMTESQLLTFQNKEITATALLTGGMVTMGLRVIRPILRISTVDAMLIALGASAIAVGTVYNSHATQYSDFIQSTDQESAV